MRQASTCASSVVALPEGLLNWPHWLRPARNLTTKPDVKPARWCPRIVQICKAQALLRPTVPHSHLLGASFRRPGGCRPTSFSNVSRRLARLLGNGKCFSVARLQPFRPSARQQRSQPDIYIACIRKHKREVANFLGSEACSCTHGLKIHRGQHCSKMMPEFDARLCSANGHESCCERSVGEPHNAPQSSLAGTSLQLPKHICMLRYYCCCCCCCHRRFLVSGGASVWIVH